MSTKFKVTQKWECGYCNEIHNREYDAEECCRPEVFEVYICPVCDDSHYSEDDAIECCPHDVDSPITVSQAELEAAGQLRLELRGVQ
jgi:hypothetical protein